MAGIAAGGGGVGVDGALEAEHKAQCWCRRGCTQPAGNPVLTKPNEIKPPHPGQELVEGDEPVVVAV